MADSLPLDTAVDSVPVPISRQESGPKSGQKSALSDDVRLKLAQHISSELEIRHVILIPGKRNKIHVIEELLAHTNEYLTPVTITKATLNKWICECIEECVEWEAEVLIEEKDGGSRKSGQDNMPDDSHKLAWVQLMRETRALTVKDRSDSAAHAIGLSQPTCHKAGQLDSTPQSRGSGANRHQEHSIPAATATGPRGLPS
jgi:hypothetical protein